MKDSDLVQTLNKIKQLAKSMDIAIITPATDHPGMCRVYSKSNPEGHLVPKLDPIDTVITWSGTVARQTNNELSKLPGFFFHPKEKEGLEELSYDQRVELLSNQGNYSVDLFAYIPGTQERNGDMECALSNARIPTHRRFDTPIPEFGKVPLDLREVIEVK